MKKLKIFLSVALVLFLGGGSYLLYLFKFKEYEVADEEVTKIIGESYKVELPNGLNLLIDENGEIIESESDKESTSNVTVAEETSETESALASEKGSSTPSSSNPNINESTTKATNDKPTVSTIKERYKPAFESLEDQADSKLDSLTRRAFNEYQEKKESTEGVNFAYFYKKYVAAANELELSTDKIFYGVMNVVEKDLIANGFDKSYAQSFKEDYEARKKARRDSLLSKALDRR